MSAEGLFETTQNDQYLELSSLTTAHLDIAEWTNYQQSGSPGQVPYTPSVSSAELRAWLRAYPASGNLPPSNSALNTNLTPLYFGKEYLTQDPRSQAALLEALTGSGSVEDTGYCKDTSAPAAAMNFPSSSTLRNKNLRILDNLLLLTSEYINESHQSIYLIFSYLLRKIVEVCDASSTWSWAEIYLRSFSRLIHQSRVDWKCKPGGRPSQASSPFSSPHSQASSSFKKSGRAPAEAKGLFHAYRTSFLISLACYLACKMAEFDPTREPQLVKVFAQSIIPMLANFCCNQSDVCDTPGVALMYVFVRVDISIQDLVFKYRRATLYTNEYTTTKRSYFNNDESSDDGSTDLGCPSTCELSSAKSSESQYLTYQLVHPKESSEDSTKVPFICKFLQVFWLRCMAMGYYRRCWTRAGNNGDYMASCSASLLSPFGAPRCVKFPSHSVNDSEFASKDDTFLQVFKKLVVDSYLMESDASVRQLYAQVFSIKRVLHGGAPAQSPAASPLYLNGRDQVLYHAGYSMVVSEFAEPRIYATSGELLRLIQNALCRLIPRHVHIKLLMLSLFKVPSTAPATSLGRYYRRNKRLSSVERSLVAVKKRVFRTSAQRAVFDRFVYYMPSLVWEGVLKDEEKC